MEVVNPRAALLSNYEVLTLLRDLEADNLARTKTAHRIKKEEEASGLVSTVPAGGGKDPTVVEVSENLRTVSFEAIQYLSAEYQPTSSQSPEAITRLVKSLEPYGLTKAEKLQIVNLAPQNHIELYVIVEELEDRLAERMEEVISQVQASLVLDPASIPPAPTIAKSQQGMENEGGEDWDVDGEYAGDEFDDKGEGAGVEGDLDMDDD
ncbi:RNA polymerase Rpb4-domain-containing protein [Mycena galericulata]|nr:RNA polymerase Rpb4-domain-containing protein [Mycena galericulata]KAJ7461714.1 RNA polymerase Rpb4-domain-containing protein [Mycena galericulata]